MSGIEKAIQSYEHLRNLLLREDFVVTEYKEINYGLQFSTQKSGWSGVIRVYQNKQGKVKTDFSQLDESNNSRLIKSLSEDQTIPSSQPLKPDLLSEIILPVIGSDESGKGDYFGPLVSACIYVDEGIANQLAILGVKDSKALSDTKILKIAKDIRRACQDKFVVIEISAERYNQLYIKFENEKNL